MNPNYINPMASGLQKLNLDEPPTSVEQDSVNTKPPQLTDHLLNQILQLSTIESLNEQQKLIQLSSVNKSARDGIKYLLSNTNPLIKNKALAVLCARLDKQDPTLLKINCSGHYFDGDDFNLLINSLKKHKDCYVIDFSYCKMGDAATALLLNTLSVSPKPITQLKLRENGLAEQSINAIVNLIKTCSMLTHIDLSYNNLGDTGFNMLQSVMEEHSNLKSVQLTYCNLSERSENRINQFHQNNPDKPKFYTF